MSKHAARCAQGDCSVVLSSCNKQTPFESIALVHITASTTVRSLPPLRALLLLHPQQQQQQRQRQRRQRPPLLSFLERAPSAPSPRTVCQTLAAHTADAYRHVQGCVGSWQSRLPTERRGSTAPTSERCSSGKQTSAANGWWIGLDGSDEADGDGRRSPAQHAQ